MKHVKLLISVVELRHLCVAALQTNSPRAVTAAELILEVLAEKHFKDGDTVDMLEDFA